MEGNLIASFDNDDFFVKDISLEEFVSMCSDKTLKVFSSFDLASDYLFEHDCFKLVHFLSDDLYFVIL